MDAPQLASMAISVANTPPHTEEEPLSSEDTPESGLWNAVLLLFLKDAHGMRKVVNRCDVILTNPKFSLSQKKQAFRDAKKARTKLRSLFQYLGSDDMTAVCPLDAFDTLPIGPE